MHIDDINKITSQYMTVKKAAPNQWKVTQKLRQSVKASAKLQVVATEPTRARALKVVKEKGYAAIEARRDGGFDLLFACPQEDYLRGMVIGAFYAAALFEQESANPQTTDLSGSREKFLQITSGLSGTAFAPIRSRSRMEDDIRMLAQYDPNFEFDSKGVYSWGSIKNFAEQIGIVQKIKFCEQQKQNLYSASVHGKQIPFEPSGPVDLYSCTQKLYYEQKCNLIVEKSGKDQYKIVYCDSGRNYLRGMQKIYQIMDPLLENSGYAPELRASIIKNLFRQEINTARINAGHSVLTPKQDLAVALEFTTARKARTAQEQ